MDLETKLFDLLYGQLAYPGTVSKADLRQLCQGHARTVVGFLVTSIVSRERKQVLQLNLRARRKPAGKPTEVRPEPQSGAGKLTTLERKLAAVRREYHVKAFRRDVSTAYKQRIAAEIQTFREISLSASGSPSALQSETPANSDVSARVIESGERLEYLVGEQKGGTLTGDTAVMVLTGSGLMENLQEAMRRLGDFSDREKVALGERSSGVSIEEEAKKQGFEYRQEGKKGSLQRTDALTLISRLRKQVESLRSHEWTEFVSVEEILARAKDLRKAFKKLQSSKASLSSPSPLLSDYLRLELALSSGRAELRSLEAGFKSLENTQESLQSRLELLRTQPTRGGKNAGEREAVLGKFNSLGESIGAYRRSLPKLKLRIKDFIAKHYAPMTESVPALAAALKDTVELEISAVKPFWTAAHRASSGALALDLASTEAKRDKIEDGKMQKVIDALGFPCYTPTSVLIDTVTVRETVQIAVSSKEIEEKVVEIHRREVQAEEPMGLARLREAEALLVAEESAVRHVEATTIPQWMAQPAQFLIPWVRDKDGLGVKDYVDLWRSHALELV